MPSPRLTFFCELESQPLVDLFDRLDLSLLSGIDAAVSLGILDLSPERAAVVRHMNQAGIPVVAWLLLPKEQGYWFNLDNAPLACSYYQEFIAWTRTNGLHWDGVGIDVEPDIQIIEQINQNRLKAIFKLAARSFDRRRLREAGEIYRDLVARIRADGYRVDSYQLPFIVDERRVRSTWLQRMAGVIDLPSDREVLMLYSSFFRPNGAGMMWSYGPEAASIGVGSTGGGVELGGLQSPPLDWREFSRDLRLAWVFCDDIHIFSLEGCLKQGFVEKMQDFKWDWPVIDPIESAVKVHRAREALRSGLWLSAHPAVVLAAMTSFLFFIVVLRRRFSGKRRR